MSNIYYMYIATDVHTDVQTYISTLFLYLFLFVLDAGNCVIHWSTGREGHNYRRDLVIWLVHLICSEVGFAVT